MAKKNEGLQPEKTNGKDGLVKKAEPKEIREKKDQDKSVQKKK